jgi:hypothetical protein
MLELYYIPRGTVSISYLACNTAPLYPIPAKPGGPQSLCKRLPGPKHQAVAFVRPSARPSTRPFHPPLVIQPSIPCYFHFHFRVQSQFSFRVR